jgi:hypothetical protein
MRHASIVLTTAVAVTVLSIVVPSRAEAQFGSITRRVKEKVVQEAGKRAAGTDSTATTADPASTPASTSNATTETDQPRRITTARKGPMAAASAAPAAPAIKASRARETELSSDLVDRAILAVNAERAQAARQHTHELQVEKARHNQNELSEQTACSEKYGYAAAQVKKNCGSVEDAVARQHAREQAERDAERRDSLQLRVPLFVGPDSAGAVAGGFTTREWGIVQERITAFLLLAADGPKAQCMRSSRMQYTFDDSESAVLSARRAELEKAFLDPSQIRHAVYGQCSKVG